MRPVRRFALAAAGVSFLLFGALSLRYGGGAALADASTLQARWVVSEWRLGRGPAFSPELWLHTRDALRQALRLTPDNPQLFDDLGFLQASRAEGMGAPEPHSAAWIYKQKLLSESVASYRAATALRPTFPYGWAYLALAKHRLGEQDAELWTAFDKAMQYGRNEAGVQPALAEIAFSEWPELSQTRQQKIDAMVSTAQYTQRNKLLAMATQKGVVLTTSAALPTSPVLPTGAAP